MAIAPSLCRWGYCLQMENATAANSVARQTSFHARTVGCKIGRATDRHDASPRSEAPCDYQDPQNVQLNTFHEEHHASFSLMHTRRSPKSREEGTQRKEEVWCYPSTPALGVNPIRGFTPRALRRVAAEHAHALPRIGGWHPGVECSVALRLNDSEYRPQIRRLRESLRSETT